MASKRQLHQLLEDELRNKFTKPEEMESDQHSARSSKGLGFSHIANLAKLDEQDPAAGHTEPYSSPLVCLLRRVALWYYDRVMFDPLDQLVQLNSSYELLFQLLTPHEQLSCMEDILMMLACPDLAQHR